MSTSSVMLATRRPPVRALLWHVALPLLGTAALIGLYFTPVQAIGCANRGIAAVGIAVASAAAALVTGWLATQTARRDRTAVWWLTSTLVLLLPILLLIWPLG